MVGQGNVKNMVKVLAVLAGVEKRKQEREGTAQPSGSDVTQSGGVARSASNCSWSGTLAGLCRLKAVMA